MEGLALDSMPFLQHWLLLLGAWNPVQECESARIQAPGWAFDGQGTALASDGQSLLVGAPFGRSYAINGSATLYARDDRDASGWSEVQRFGTPVPGTIDRFGHALDVDGDVIAIGAWRERQARGAVYLFERRDSAAPFELCARLEPPLARPGQRFGYSLDLDGERLLVGTPRGAPAPDFPWEGRGYLYERDPLSGIWLLQATLAHPDPVSFQPNLGNALALSGDLAVMGSFYFGFGISTEVHVFVDSGGTWQHRQLLSERDVGGPGFQSFFGAALALQGNELYILDPESSELYVFERTPSGPTEFAWSDTILIANGWNVEVRGDRMAIGTRSFRAPSTVQILERVGRAWLPGSLLTGCDPAGSDAFGRSIVVEPDRVLIGDPGLPGPVQPEVGGVQVFRVLHHTSRVGR